MSENISKTKRSIILTGVLIVAFLIYLNSTIISTATPKIVASLNGMAYVSWISSIYMLASVVCIPVFGKLSDMYGRKYFYLGGIGIFIIGSVLSGTAQTMTMLILFRAVQGMGCGIITAISSAMLADIYTPAERGKAQGYLGGVMGIASVFGPLVGGILVDKLSWRSVFFINVPIGIIAIIVLWFAIEPTIKSQKSRSIDWAGTVFIAIFSIPLLLAFTWGGDKYAWRSWQIIGMLSLSVIALLVLLFIEKQAKEAVIPLSLFQNSIFNITTITVFLLNALMYGVINYMPLFVQGSMKLSASASGLMMVPMMLGYAAATIVGGQIISRTKKYKVLYFTGFIIMFVGTLIFSFLSMNTSSVIVTAAMFVFGIGAGISFSISMIIVQNAFPYSKVGTVTASFQFFRNFGSVIGVSLLGLVLNNQFRAESKEIVASATKQAMPDNILHMLTSPQSLFDADKLAELLQTVPQNLLDSFHKLLEQSRIALATSMRDVFIVIAIVALVSIILAAFLKEIPLRESNDK